MDNTDIEFLKKMVTEIRKQFPNLSDQECSKMALDCFALKTQQSYNNFTQPQQQATRSMSKEEFDEKLQAIKSEKSQILSSNSGARSTYTAELLRRRGQVLLTKRHQERLSQLDDLEIELRRRYTLEE